jgi:Icc-related predicted phosphoesterase
VKASAALILTLLASGCLDVAEERAQREEEIGHARADVAEVRIEDGLASVQRLDREGLALWGGAPGLTIHLTFAAGPPARFTLAVDNAMPEAVLTGATDAVPSDGAVPTERRWTFTPPPAGGELVLTVAPPDASTPGAFRFAAMADVQEAIGKVQDVYRRINEDPRIRFVVFDGDLTQWGNTEELRRFQRECKSLRVPMFATLGNHELSNRPPPFHAVFGRGSFRYLFRGVQFTMLDSGSATIAPTTYTRLDGWLQEGQARLHIVGMHIPPIDPVGTRNGAFASRAEAARLLAMLARGGVDLTLYGHIHSYYSFWNAGIPAYISGGGGALPERFDGIGRHFLVIDADPVANVVEAHAVRVD